MVINEYWRWTESAWQAKTSYRAGATIVGGVDVGSVSTKAVILADDEIYAYANSRTGSSSPESASMALHAALADTGLKLEDIHYLVGTGYGRVNVPFANRTITEIACHARGAHYMDRSIRTILDMGGQEL